MLKTIKNSIKYCEKCDLKITEQDKTFSIMYWLPKMHKTPIGARFIVVTKSSCTKPLSDVIFKVLNMSFNHIESLHRNILFNACSKTF